MEKAQFEKLMAEYKVALRYCIANGKVTMEEFQEVTKQKDNEKTRRFMMKVLAIYDKAMETA